MPNPSDRRSDAETDGVAVRRLMASRAGVCSRPRAGRLLQLARLLGLGVLALGSGGCPSDPIAGLGPDPVKPGSLLVTVAGLPAGGAAAVVVSGPGGFTRNVSSSETLAALTPGSYTVSAADVTVDGDQYQAAPVAQTVQVPAGNSVEVTISHAITSGRIALQVSGVPDGSAQVSLTGPGGVSVAATGSAMLTGLVPGNYLIRGATVTVSGDQFAAVDSQLVLVTPGTTPTPAAVLYQLASGRLNLVVTGVPAGVTPMITLDGPAGFSAAATGNAEFTGLLPGQYTVAGNTVTLNGDVYGAVVTPAFVTITATPTPATATVDYRIETGSLAVDVSGLPAGVDAAVLVTGPGGFSQVVTGDQTLKGLVPGTYTIGGSNVVSGGALYIPQPTSQTVSIAASTTPVARTVAYTQGVGAIALTVAGLPPGAPAAITITGPNGYSNTLTGSATLAALFPGNYTVTTAAVSAGGHQFQATAPVQPVVVGVSTTTAVSVTYTQTTGSLAVSVAGLPGGVPAAVTVTGPGGFSQNVTATTTLDGLAPGSYTVAAAAVSSGGQNYTPSPASQNAPVVAAGTATALVVYAGTLGGLTVNVSGLPGGTAAAVTVTGPGGFNQSVTATTTFTGLASGTYSITAANVSSGGYSYLPSPTSQTAGVSAGTTVSRSVAYSPTGSLTVTVTGLPGGTAGAVTVTGPGGYNQLVTATQTLINLTPGAYTVAAASVSSGGTSYTPSPTSQAATVTGAATTSRTVTYAASTGALTVTISGLPGGVLASVNVSGPGGYSQNVTATTTLTGLAPGSYTVTAGNVTSGPTTYVPTPTSQTPTVSNGATASAAVAYAPGAGASLNLTIAGMYLTQGAAKFDGTTRLVTGRNAYLRVFIQANQANTATPTVRVRFYSSGTLVQTSTLNAPGASVPTAIAEGTLTSSWNLAVAGSLIQPNLTILADVDPTNAVAESSDADNMFPVSGTPVAVDVRTVPTLNLRFVPVLQSVNGLQGNVTAGNMATFMIDPLKLLPVSASSTNLRAVYTTNAPVLESGNGNNAWSTILSEVNALKAADGNSSEYYYGVVKTTYSSGVAGIGYVGGGARTALGWDRLPSGSGVMAHELGHNMSLPHAPCGGPASPDPLYPYAGGVIGVWGLDLGSLTLKDPAVQKDFMTYCSPEWISDYNWNKMITYRQSNPNYAPPAVDMPAATSGLLVWGRITSAGVVLEPSFRVGAPTQLPRGSGAYRVQGLAADGRVVFDYPVDPVLTSNETRVEHHITAVVPMDAAMEASVVRVRLVTPAGPAERVSLQSLAQSGGRLFFRDPAATMTRPTAVQASLTWDGTVFPMAMVRDAATGEILSFARGGSAVVWTGSRRFDVTFSDGVRSVVRRVE